MNKGFAVVLGMAGVMSWYWPTYNGFWSPPVDVSVGEGHIIGAIFIVGGMIVWFLRPPKD
ncbi:MAG: hypothetical protein COA84_11130 [Robiginitomaculum sp.]|nr:MAG: hypothetical protein COA84_11130 [Robiginitomaculum sp.]